MPKSATLPAGEDLTVLECAGLSVILADTLRKWLRLTHHESYDVTTSEPFEHVAAPGATPIDL
jgi:hypothetical protein